MYLPDSLVDNDAQSVLGDIVHTARPAVVHLVGHTLLDCAKTLKQKTTRRIKKLQHGGFCFDNRASNAKILKENYISAVYVKSG